MAIKNLFEVFLVEHNDAAKSEGEEPIRSNVLFVMAKNPAQAHSKVVKALGDKLIFVEQIRLAATNNDSLVNVSNVVRLV